ncbi:hypothetical protein PRUPE_7G007800 [Prunus persica]|uniref:Uncharacterized protein n=1 Tax=Prunus persica TaxID=3760 RepID=A0A251N4K7_PRUPE|nr:hypothetical protein PRUPE_7G007800 [Prunus persica]
MNIPQPSQTPSLLLIHPLYKIGGREEELGEAQGKTAVGAGHARKVLHSDPERVGNGAVCGGYIFNWVNRSMAHVHFLLGRSSIVQNHETIMVVLDFDWRGIRNLSLFFFFFGSPSLPWILNCVIVFGDSTERKNLKVSSGGGYMFTVDLTGRIYVVSGFSRKALLRCG